MEQFLQDNRSLVVSTLFMVMGLMAAGYSIFYTRTEAMIADIQVATSNIQGKTQAIQGRIAEIQALNAAQSKEDVVEEIRGSIKYPPNFLFRINEIAHNNDVIIRSLEPTTIGGLKFNMEVITDYFTFIRFTSQLESLDIVLDDLRVEHFDERKTPPLHFITFSLIPRNDAEPLSSKRIEMLKQWVAQRDRRNPFQRFAFDPNRAKARPVVDLTPLYKLSGIGRTPDGQRYATINNANYHEGDALDGRIITKIEPSHILLEKDGKEGIDKFILKFRRSAGQVVKVLR